MAQGTDDKFVHFSQFGPTADYFGCQPPKFYAIHSGTATIRGIIRHDTYIKETSFFEIYQKEDVAGHYDDVLKDHGIEPGTTGLERGFMTPQGFKTRGDAYEWLRQNDPEAYQKLADAGVSELHTQDMNEVQNG